MMRVVLALLLVIVFMPTTTYANSAPIRPGDRGGVLLPAPSDQIHVGEERLSFVLSDTLDAARATARYRLENRGGAVAALPVAFVIYDGGRVGEGEVSVTWEGAALPIAESRVPAVEPDAEPRDLVQWWNSPEPDLDPVTGETYYEGIRGKGSLRFARFELALAAGGSGVLEVSYRHTPAFDRSRYTHPIYHYRYLLLPAKAWASFGPLEIRVEAPESAYLAANLPFTYKDGAYVARLAGLPEQNLAFSVMSRRGIMGGLLQPGPYFWMAFALLLAAAVALGLAAGRLARRVRRRGLAIGLAVGGSLLLGFPLEVALALGILYLFPALHDQSYLLILAAFAHGFVGAVLTAIVSGIVVSKKPSAA